MKRPANLQTWTTSSETSSHGSKQIQAQQADRPSDGYAIGLVDHMNRRIGVCSYLFGRTGAGAGAGAGAECYAVPRRVRQPRGLGASLDEGPGEL
ncbi:uncharacterized protein PG998_013898 [Apiospora kogelbergensis]|uniref:uncharacterized protein n=1 Tax=Apiospora kogelbergensis TaxID=1337665 RepID=UPI003130FC3E